MGGVLLLVRTATVLLHLLLWRCRWAEAVWMNLPKSGTKCVSEEIQANVVVLANYMALYDDDQPVTSAAISVKVTSPYGSTLHHQENVTRGEFAFTTTEPGNYLACFWLDGEKRDSVVSVSLNWRIGIAAKDWDTVARKEKIEGVQLELKKLEEVVEEIHENLLLLRDREAEMRNTSEKTNSRVAWCSILSLAVCITVSALQLWHLKGFFQKKKLI